MPTYETVAHRNLSTMFQEMLISLNHRINSANGIDIEFTTTAQYTRTWLLDPLANDKK